MNTWALFPFNPHMLSPPQLYFFFFNEVSFFLGLGGNWFKRLFLSVTHYPTSPSPNVTCRDDVNYLDLFTMTHTCHTYIYVWHMYVYAYMHIHICIYMIYAWYIYMHTYIKRSSHTPSVSTFLYVKDVSVKFKKMFVSIFNYYIHYYLKVELLSWLRWWTVCLQGRRRGFHSWIRKIPWRREWLTRSSIFVWIIPWAEEPGGLQGSQIVEHDWSNGWPFIICTLSLGSQTRVILNTLSFPGLSPQGLWQCLETFWLSHREGLEGGGEWCYCYLVSRYKGVAEHPTMSRAALHNKTWSGPKCVCCQETLVLAELVQETPSLGELGLPTSFDGSTQAVVMFHVVLGSEWKVLN